jgi:hypothetical protein
MNLRECLLFLTTLRKGVRKEEGYGGEDGIYVLLRESKRRLDVSVCARHTTRTRGCNVHDQVQELGDLSLESKSLGSSGHGGDWRKMTSREGRKLVSYSLRHTDLVHT